MDVVFDPVGGALLSESLKCVRWGARILIIGFASGAGAGLWLGWTGAVGWPRSLDIPLAAPLSLLCALQQQQ